jgi:hypothetical protein
LCAFAIAGARGESVSAQSVIFGGVSGRIVDLDGIPVGGVAVTLQNLQSGLARELIAERNGTFRFEFISPGSYELRAEAIGYRPLIGRTVALEPGTSLSVELPIRPEPPPITRADTVDLGAVTAPSRTPFGGEFGVETLSRIPDAGEDLTGIAAMASDFDEALGSEGLPGQFSLPVIDGVPFYSAAHPRSHGDGLSSPLFPRSSLLGVRLSPGVPDVEWTGGAGSYITAASRSSAAAGNLELDAGWSGDALWSSGQLDLEAPSLTSFWANGRTGFDRSLARIRASEARLGIQPIRTPDVQGRGCQAESELRRPRALRPSLRRWDSGGAYGLLDLGKSDL